MRAFDVTEAFLIKACEVFYNECRQKLICWKSISIIIFNLRICVTLTNFKPKCTKQNTLTLVMCRLIGKYWHFLKEPALEVIWRICIDKILPIPFNNLTIINCLSCLKSATLELCKTKNNLDNTDMSIFVLFCIYTSYSTYYYNLHFVYTRTITT